MDENVMMYDSFPAVNELNRVAGFDPRKLMCRRVLENGESGFYLDLKYRKLWFRLKHPAGRIIVKTRLINEQRAIFEAKLYLDKSDTEPVSCCTAQRYAQGKLGSLYVEGAQHAAISQVLDDAGFGIQFCDVSQPSDCEIYGSSMVIRGDDVVPIEHSATNAAPPAPSAPSGAEEMCIETQPLVTVDTLLDAGNETTAADEAVPGESLLPTDAETAEVEHSAEPAVDTSAFAVITNEDADELPTAYSADMSVEEIADVMSLEDAAAIIIDVGVCKGWTLAEVAEKRPASLKWYINGYTGDNNILRAGAKLLLNEIAASKAG